MSKTERLENDYYPTPQECLTPLLNRIDFSKVNSFLEPCAGDHRIINQINCPNKYYAELQEGIDYLTTDFPQVDLIITNPPFSISLDFIKKSLIEGKTVCYLQRLNWLGSKLRKDFWNNNIPDKIFVLSKRPQFKKELGLGGGTDSTEYCWFIWDKLNIVEGKHLEIF